MAHGLDPDGFWWITPRELAARLDGAQRRLSAEQDHRAWLAWTTAALIRAPKLPDLDSMFVRKTEQPAQTPAQIEISADQLFLAWGGDPEQLAQVREIRRQA